jgi:hypothetical protein
MISSHTQEMFLPSLDSHEPENGEIPNPAQVNIPLMDAHIPIKNCRLQGYDKSSFVV